MKSLKITVKTTTCLTKNQNKNDEENTWIAVEFNYYLLQFMIVTRKQIRYYDPSDGSLVKVLSDFLKKKHINDIWSFWLDDRHRKFFIGDVFGNINAYNASSGVHIKTVEYAGYNISSVLNKVSSEITSLYFLKLLKTSLLFSSTWDSYIKAYDEDDPEESSLLRRSKGALQIEDIKPEDDWMKIITILVIDEHLGLIATGSSIGKIAVWDLESFKIEAFLTGNSKEITTMTFITPYPLLVAGCSDGFIWIYGVRGIDLEWKYSCLTRIINTDENIMITQLEADVKDQVQIGVNSLFIRKSGPLLETDTHTRDIYQKFVIENQEILNSDQLEDNKKTDESYK